MLKQKPAPDLIANTMDAIKAIEHESEQKKKAHADTLSAAKLKLLSRVDEIHHQILQINDALEKLTGRKIEPKPRRDLDEIRSRVYAWMKAHAGYNYLSADLIREFPELVGVAISVFLKPFTRAGAIKIDATHGIRRQSYYVEAQ
jgi:hypothetical protein